MFNQELRPSDRELVCPPHKCIWETISKLKGEIIGGTKEVVARASLNKDACYDPKLPRKEPA